LAQSIRSTTSALSTHPPSPSAALATRRPARTRTGMYIDRPISMLCQLARTRDADSLQLMGPIATDSPSRPIPAGTDSLSRPIRTVRVDCVSPTWMLKFYRRQFHLCHACRVVPLRSRSELEFESHRARSLFLLGQNSNYIPHESAGNPSDRAPTSRRAHRASSCNCNSTPLEGRPLRACLSHLIFQHSHLRTSNAGPSIRAV